MPPPAAGGLQLQINPVVSPSRSPIDQDLLHRLEPRSFVRKHSEPTGNDSPRLTPRAAGKQRQAREPTLIARYAEVVAFGLTGFREDFLSRVREFLALWLAEWREGIGEGQRRAFRFVQRLQVKRCVRGSHFFTGGCGLGRWWRASRRLGAIGGHVRFVRVGRIL